MPQNNTPFAPETASAAFATKDEVNLLSNEITVLKSKIDGLTAKPVGRPKKEVAEE
jgi:hypothetical protein